MEPNTPCSTVDFEDDRVKSYYGEENPSLVPAPQVLEESCAILNPAYSYMDLGSFEDTCVLDYRFCMSTVYTWSLCL